MEVVNDFPAGAPRLVQKSKGSRMTLVNFNANVNGQVSVQDGEHTGTRARTVLRQPNC